MPPHPTARAAARVTPLLIALLLTLPTVAIHNAAAQEARETGTAREVYKNHADSVVWVSAVIKLRGGGAFAGMMGNQEQKVEAVGTVIHESGLTVVSLMNIDPTSLMNAMFAAQKIPGHEGKLEFQSELSGVRIRRPDGKEVPGRLVLKDEDLDLAFVLPTDASAKLKHLPLSGGDGGGADKEAPPLNVLDPIIVLSRLGQELDRQPAVRIGRVAAVVKKPRTFYVAGGEIEALGVPVFALDGRPVGIMMMRRQSIEGMAGGMMSIGRASTLAPVVIPAADVMEVAQQALAAKDRPEADRGDAKEGGEDKKGAAKTGKKAPDKSGHSD